VNTISEVRRSEIDKLLQTIRMFGSAEHIAIRQKLF
jgi:hypothetical protein